MKSILLSTVTAACLFVVLQPAAAQLAPEVKFFALKEIAPQGATDLLSKIVTQTKMSEVVVHSDQRINGVWVKAAPAEMTQLKSIIKFCDRDLDKELQIKFYVVADTDRLAQSAKRAFRNSKSFEMDSSNPKFILVKGSEVDHDIFKELKFLTKAHKKSGK